MSSMQAHKPNGRFRPLPADGGRARFLSLSRDDADATLGDAVLTYDEYPSLIEAEDAETLLQQIVLELLVEQLPERLRSVVEMVDIAGMRRRAVAAQLGVDRRTVDRRLTIAHDLLRTALTDEDRLLEVMERAELRVRACFEYLDTMEETS